MTAMPIVCPQRRRLAVMRGAPGHRLDVTPGLGQRPHGSVDDQRIAADEPA
jgi:hypothetical protein